MRSAAEHSRSTSVRVRLVGESEIIIRGLAVMLRPFSARVRILIRETGESGRQARGLDEADVVLFDCFAEPVRPDDVVFARWMYLPGSRERLVAYCWQLHPDLVTAALNRGARAYLSKSLSAAHLVAALETIRDEHLVVAPQADHRSRRVQVRWPERGLGLTPRERDVIALVTSGCRNDEIAAALSVSINSVKSYIRSAYRRIGVTSRSQAVLWGVEHGYASPLTSESRGLRVTTRWGGSDHPGTEYDGASRELLAGQVAAKP